MSTVPGLEDFSDDDDDDLIIDTPKVAAPATDSDFGLFDDEALVKHPWMAHKRFILVTEGNLTECIDACINGVNKRFSLDLETTGIDNRVFNGETKDKIVGVCLSGDGMTGWYIPLRHQNTKTNPTAAKHNIPFMTFDREFRRLMAAVDGGKVVAVFHNAKFDQEFLEFNGHGAYGNWDVPRHWEDTIILAYLRHSRARKKSLKILAGSPAEDPTQEQIALMGGRGLGMKMYELSDLFPKPEKGRVVEYDYSKLDPSQEGPLIYGCSDGICTWLLADLLIPEVLSPKKHSYDQRVIYTVEKLCVVATRWMERNLLQTDPNKVMELIKLGQQEWFNAVMEVYRAAGVILGRDVMPGYYKVLKLNPPGATTGGFVPDDHLNLLNQQVERAKRLENGPIGYPNPMGVATARGKTWPLVYDVNAPQQLGQMFEEMAVPGLKYTEKSGQVMTAKAELERVIDEAADRFPFMVLIKRFRETNKALTSYLYPMLEHVDPSNHTMRISFNAHKVDTGRFSTPAKERELESAKTKEIAGWPEINLQSMPAGYDPKRPACMTRLRECVVARPGYYIVAIDFSGEELRLVTNLSGEPKWLEEFFHCTGCNRKFPQGQPGKTPVAPPSRCPNCGSDKIGDLHTLTALSIYGQDAGNRADWKKLRGNAKGVNFALCYGGGGNAVVRACSVDKNEGWRIKNAFDETYLGLKKWWAGQHRFANEHGFVLTAWGRIYPVPDIWSAERMWIEKAKRNSVNGPIQGSGADIIKIAMGKVYLECKKRGWLDLVKMVATMHDELVFEMHGSIIEEAIAVLTPVMTSNSLIMGKNWPVPMTTDCEIGLNWAVNWDLNGMRHREVRFDGDKKVKEPKKPSRDDFIDDDDGFQKALAAYPNKKAAWEAMPHSWPAELRQHFTNLGPAGKGAQQSPPQMVPPAPVPASLSLSAEVQPQEMPGPETSPEIAERVMLVVDEGPVVPVYHPPSAMKSGETYDFTLRGALTPGMCANLAEVINACQHGGTKKLRLLLPDGTVLQGWSDTDYFIIPNQFYWQADARGL